MSEVLSQEYQCLLLESVTQSARQAYAAMAEDAGAPHVLMRPRIFPDGNQWCALYGEDLQMGVAGFGDTPAEAAADFDLKWSTQKLPSGVPLNEGERNG